MNKSILIGLSCLALIFVGYFIWSKVAGASIGNLNIYEGTVEVLRKGDTIEGETGWSLKKLDMIKTGSGSRISIILKDGSVIRLEADSKVEIVNLAHFRLLEGKMWSKVEPLSLNANWQVETPTAVASVRGTQFNTRYSDKSSGVSVYGGKVGVALLKDRLTEKFLIKNNQFILSDDKLEEDFVKDPIVMDPSKYDDWILFNLGEDAKLENKVYEPVKREAVTTTTTATTTTTIISPTIPASAKLGEKKLLAVSILGNKSIILVNEETKVKATAKYSDNSNYEIPFEKIIWIRNPKTGSLTPPGYFSSSKPGTFVLQAEFEGIKSGPVTIAVKESLKVIKRLNLAYVKNYTETQTNYRYPTLQFTVTAIFDDNSTEDVTSKSNWEIVSGDPKGGISSTGLYSPTTEGSMVVKATFETKSNTISIQIP